VLPEPAAFDREVETGLGLPRCSCGNGQLINSILMLHRPRNLMQCNYRSPGHLVDGGSLAEIFVGRSATKWLRLSG
jgi:hypothetical protein